MTAAEDGVQILRALRRANQRCFGLPLEEQDGSRCSVPKPLPQPVTKSLLVSILSLGRTEDVLALLAKLPDWLAAFAQSSGIAVRLVVRNNDPTASFATVHQRFVECEQRYPALRCTLITGEANVGFGRGHNENFRRFPSDYLLILNDDIGFPHIEWLAGVLAE
jgi:GT2 family glycosyltransferase